MKVKNIMFSGFAAAILMGVAAEANAAPTTKVVASKGYVDAVAGPLGDLSTSAKDNLVKAINEVNANKQAKFNDGVDVSSTDGFIYEVKQDDGTVTAQQKAFDTVINDTTSGHTNTAPTTQAVANAIAASVVANTYTGGTDITVSDDNKISANYGSLDYDSGTDAADNANKLDEGYAVSYVTQTDGKVKIGAKAYVNTIRADEVMAPTTDAVYNALQGKQNTLEGAQLDAVNSGITAGKVSTYDGYATSKQDALNADQLAAVNSTITAEKVATFAAKQDALSEGQLAATNSGITAGKVSTYDGYATSKQDALTTAQLGAVNSGITATKVQQYDAIPVMPAACQESGVVCVLSSEEGVYMWSVLAQPYAYTSGEAATVTDGITAQEQKINPDVNPHL